MLQNVPLMSHLMLIVGDFRAQIILSSPLNHCASPGPYTPSTNQLFSGNSHTIKIAVN